jgi:hypothetical protein
MKRIWHIMKEMLHLIRTHKLYVIAPLLISLVILAFLAFVVGPTAALTFIYAGF